MKIYRCISTGMGVQSTANTLMAEHGEIPNVDFAIFADTGAEPKAVYDHLKWMQKTVTRFPIYVVSHGNLKQDITDFVNGKRDPLLEKRMTREDCLLWIKKHGYPTPPRSACIFCPYHNNYEWKKIKENRREWQEAVEFDKVIRNYPKLDSKAYLHREMIPLDEVELDGNPEQLNFFSNECEGVCGL